MLKNNAKINLSDKEGNTPLHIASINNFSAIAKHLILNKAKLNKKNKNGWAPLHHTAFMGHLLICQTLLNNDAKADIKTNKNQSGMMPIHLAALKGHNNIITLLCSAFPYQLEIRTEDTLNPLHIATKFNQINTVEYLLKCNASINSVNKIGSTALHIATGYGNVSIAKLLLDKGAKQLTDRNLMTPLDLAYKLDKHSLITLFKSLKKVIPLTS